jgi:hypothetical protein
VKYAQCVKIWIFLMDTILNLTIFQLLMKKKKTRSNYTGLESGKRESANETRVTHLSKGRHMLCRCVSYLGQMDNST